VRSQPSPVQVSVTAVSVAAGGSHSLVLLEDGTVSAWGHNSFGQVGDNTTNDAIMPVPVSD
jgi:alpha-tubulin suppressor-like RCC1 family protein